TGFSASRNTTGTSDLHLELEQRLASFKGTDDAAVFASGYMGNRLLLEALRSDYTAVFADAMAHPSVTDAIPRDIQKVFRYEHCNAGHLEELLESHHDERPLVITDGIFALTGEIAPLDRIYAISVRHNATLIVDDAHSTGLLGVNGRGTPEHFGLDGEPGIYQSETMSKALGSYGGFIAGNLRLTGEIRKGSPFFAASTALPPPVVAAGIASLSIIVANQGLRVRALRNAAELRSGVKESGFDTTDTIAPVIPVFFNTPVEAAALSGFLYENGIIAPAVSYPVKTGKYIVRITVSAVHTAAHIETLTGKLRKYKNNERHKD
ncbi:MAG: pyridoxal phosphate-dependent aminotransferase family protein, partial [Bacteroidetes bacterium]|nr:pyridoxal phosphate-dependent aminotransferase family protein [Bacteroidota bacterium]